MRATETLIEDLQEFFGNYDIDKQWLEERNHLVYEGIKKAKAMQAYNKYIEENEDYILHLANWHLSDKGFDFAEGKPLKRTLDFGAGIGTRGIARALAGHSVDFVEKNKPMRDFINFRLSRLGLPGEVWGGVPKHKTYQYIICCDVIGHLSDPGQMMTELLLQLESPGTLNVTWDNWEDDVHTNSTFDFESLFAECGLRPTRFHTIWDK